MTTMNKLYGLARLEASTQPEFLAGVGKVRESEWGREKGTGGGGWAANASYQLNIGSFVSCQLSGYYY